MELQQLILELTQQISDQTAYLRWSHWLAVAVLMFLTTSAGAFFGSYWKKSGEIKAVSDQITTLQNELAANTRIVAEVQTTVSHGDWKKREVSTMRRLKLEELIRSAHECRAWVKDIWMDAWNDTSKAADASPAANVSMLATLYLRELAVTARSLALMTSTLRTLAANLRVARREREAAIAAPDVDLQGIGRAYERWSAASKELTVIHLKGNAVVLRYISQLEAQAASLLNEIVGEEIGYDGQPPDLTEEQLADVQSVYRAAGLADDEWTPAGLSAAKVRGPV